MNPVISRATAASVLLVGSSGAFAAGELAALTDQFTSTDLVTAVFAVATVMVTIALAIKGVKLVQRLIGNKPA